ncbi:MAG: hypothetical protein ACRENE_20275 [Polyangiaceae bacterium]
MIETLLSLLQDLPDWDVYREVAAELDGDQLLSWRRFYESHPEREALLREAARALAAQASKRFPQVVRGPRNE